jgi:uncharacterized protein
MKKLSIVLSVILFVGCTPDKEYKTIILKSTGLVEIIPDEANIVINASCVNKDINQAKSCLINITSNLNDDLLSSGILKDNILTTNVSLTKDYIWRNNSDIFNGYRASTTTSIKISDLKTLDELYSKLLSNEKLTISSLTYGYSKMDSINEIAYLNALDNANKLADKILSQLPEKKKEITQVSNLEIPKSNINPELKYERYEANQEVEKSTITVNIGKMIAIQQLYVEYKIY